MPLYSRRDFLKLGALAMFGLAFDFTQVQDDPSYPLGRVVTPYLRVRLKPTDEAKQVDWLGLDEVIQIYGNVLGEDRQIWHEIEGGFVESVEVQPVANQLNPVITNPPANGFVGEITVPFTDARRQAQPTSSVVYRLYFGSTVWVHETAQGSDGQAWYKIYDERLGVNYYAPAAHVRLVPADETAPLRPNASDKRVVVNLKQQRLYAYEGKREVYSTLISAGRLYTASDGTTHSWTPPGDFQIERKKPVRHMGFGEATGSDYELPGVPWVSYFHWKGLSFHGTWWHNAYGHPRSAGCVNMRPKEALWIYRWSQPTAIPDQELTIGAGTAVEIVEN
jgi:L,D-transpeptidase catalytic domain